MGAVTFRRIHGRIVPIKSKGEASGGMSPKMKSVLAPIAAGAGVGAVTAELASQAVKRSADLRLAAKKSFKLSSAYERAAKAGTAVGGQTSFNFGTQIANNWKRSQAIRRQWSSAIFAARRPILALGTAASASLIGTGLSRTKLFKRKTAVAQAQQDTIVAGAAALGIGALYYTRLGAPIRSALTNAILRVKKIPRPNLPIKGVQGVLRF